MNKWDQVSLILIFLMLTFLYGCRFTTKPARNDLVVCITFDDNYPSVYQYALPAMNRYGYRGTMFVNSGLIGNSYYISWDKVDSLYKNYHWEVGGHTLNHENLANLSPQQAEYAVKTDFDTLMAHGYNPVSFATSFGICPTEYYPIIKKYYRNIRTTFDNAMYNPVNRTFLGCFPVVITLSPQDVENRITQAALDNENLVILLFHRLNPGQTNISNYEPEKFAEVMARINKLGVKVLPLNEALDYLERD